MLYPTVLSANVRSAFPKLDTIKLLLNTRNIDCFVASETWFRECHSDDMTSIPDFDCFRDDRPDRVGGGVAIWCKRHLYPEKIQTPDKPQGIEIIAVKVRPKMLLIGAYIPPQVVSSHHEEMPHHFVDFNDTFLILLLALRSCCVGILID